MPRTLAESWGALRDWVASQGRAGARLVPAPADALEQLAERGAPDEWLRSLAVHDGDLVGVCAPYQLSDARGVLSALAQGVPSAGWPVGRAEQGPDVLVLASGEVAEIRHPREQLVVAPSFTAWLSSRADDVAAGRVVWHELRGHAVTAERAPDTTSIPRALPDLDAATAALLAALRADGRVEIPELGTITVRRRPPQTRSASIGRIVHIAGKTRLAFEVAADLTEAVNGRSAPPTATALGRALRDRLVEGRCVAWPRVGEIGTRVPAGRAGDPADRRVWFWFHPDFVGAVQSAQS